MISDSVLVVIDMQNGFVSSKSAHIVPAVVDLVDRWQAAGRPFIMTRFINQPGSQFEKLIGWTRMQGPPETDITDALRDLSAKATAVIDKPIYSALYGEGRDLIEEHGWKNLVLAGIATESCVLKTATDAFEQGLIPWIVSDCVYSHAGAEAHEAGLLVAGRFIGRRQLVTADQVLAAHTESTAAV